MGSREANTPPHQPLLSSLVVRATNFGGRGGGGGAASDYEPGEVRRDLPPYSRSDRCDDHGHRMRAGSVSPVQRRNEHHRFSPGFERSGAAPRSHVFGRGRNHAIHRDHSPPHGHGRFAVKGYDRPGHGRGALRVESLPRNNPNVQQREGDWLCSDPSCKNLNFARRDNCNNCNRPRYGPGGSPRRGYPTPPFPPRQRFPSPPFVRSHSPGRITNGTYNRYPPHIYAPRDLRSSGPPPSRYGPLRGDYPEDYPIRDRYRHDKSMPLDWAHRDRGRDSSRAVVGGYGRRVMSPPPPPPPPPRERTRSPVRGKDYHPRDMYMNRGRGERRVGREAF